MELRCGHPPEINSHQLPSKLSCQNHGRAKGCSFMILGPRWADRTSQAGDPALHPAGRISECRLRLLLEVSLANCRDRNFQTFTSSANRATKEIAFRRMNQRVRGENLRKRWQRATCGQEDGRTYDATMAPVQFPDRLLDCGESQALGDSRTVGKVSLRLGQSEAGSMMIWLLGAGDRRIGGDNAPPVHHLHGVGISGNGHQHSPTGMHSNPKGCALHV